MSPQHLINIITVLCVLNCSVNVIPLCRELNMAVWYRGNVLTQSM